MEEKPKRKIKKQPVQVEVVKEEKPKRVAKKKKTVEVEVEMQKFKCVVCGQEHFDMNLYFHDKPSTKCLWCAKFPKKEKKK